MIKLRDLKKQFRNILFALAFMPIASLTNVAQAAVNNPSEPMVSITFDDWYTSYYTIAAPVLESRNLNATLFLSTGKVGKTGSLTWTQVQQLQNQYGWEIGGHTVNHKELPKLTTAQIEYEVSQSKIDLVNHQINAVSFATPFGAYDNRSLAIIAKYYQSHRGFWDRADMNAWPYNDQVLMVQSVENNTTSSQISQWVNQAKAESKWLILVLHEVVPTYDSDYLYSVTTNQLTEMADLIKQSNLKTVTIKDGLAQTQGSNLLPNSSFESGLVNGWSTDNASRITVDTNNKGQGADYKKSIRLRGIANQNIHLFSPSFGVSNGSSYLIKSFVNTDNLTIGELGFYMDEYNAYGQYISGKWLGLVVNDTVAGFSKTYTPSSAQVASARLQVYLTKNSSNYAYVDNIQVIPLETTQPNPVSNNLIQNGGFETITANWAASWQTDSTTFKLSTTSQGAEGKNSINVTNTALSSHLFSAQTIINSTQSYRWQTYVSATSVSGEFGFYIDEYDVNGNWVSGQWKGMINSTFKGIYQIDYVPSSTNVASINLQYYATAGNYQINLDDVKLTPQ